MQDITVTELKAKLDANENVVMIDVREPFEYEQFNIGGQLIPLGSLPAALEDLEEHKEEEIVMICRSGNRSGAAKQMMAAQGFTKVRNLLGGMLDWQRESINP